MGAKNIKFTQKKSSIFINVYFIFCQVCGSQGLNFFFFTFHEHPRCTMSLFSSSSQPTNANVIDLFFHTSLDLPLYLSSISLSEVSCLNSRDPRSDGDIWMETLKSKL